MHLKYAKMLAIVVQENMKLRDNRAVYTRENVWSAPEKKQILLICSELEIAGQFDICVTSASVSSPILILTLRSLVKSSTWAQLLEAWLALTNV